MFNVSSNTRIGRCQMELAGLLVRNLTAGNASCVPWAIGGTACHRLVLKGAGNDWTGATHTEKACGANKCRDLTAGSATSSVKLDKYSGKCHCSLLRS